MRPGRWFAGSRAGLAVLLALVSSAVPAHSQSEVPVPAGAGSYFGGVITLELEAPSEVFQHEQLEGLRVVMTNHGDEPFPFSFSGDFVDFVVRDSRGVDLWKYLTVSTTPLLRRTLAPGESITVGDARWDLRFRDGFPAEPGTYQVNGVLRFSPGEVAVSREDRVHETAAHDLVIREAPLPEYARTLQLELIVPAKVRVDDPTPMDLRLSNTGDERIRLRWSQTNMVPRENALDIVIFRDGVEIWRATHANNIRSSGHFTLEAGESRLMSDVFDEAGRVHRANCEQRRLSNCDDPVLSVPGEWDQRVHCGRYIRFEPCAEPIGPGVYAVRAMANVSSPFESREKATVVAAPRQLTIIE